jgi:hypothetical protein
LLLALDLEVCDLDPQSLDVSPSSPSRYWGHCAHEASRHLPVGRFTSPGISTSTFAISRSARWIKSSLSSHHGRKVVQPSFARIGSIFFLADRIPAERFLDDSVSDFFRTSTAGTGCHLPCKRKSHCRDNGSERWAQARAHAGTAGKFFGERAGLPPVASQVRNVRAGGGCSEYDADARGFQHHGRERYQLDMHSRFRGGDPLCEYIPPRTPSVDSEEEILYVSTCRPALLQSIPKRRSSM